MGQEVCLPSIWLRFVASPEHCKRIEGVAQCSSFFFIFLLALKTFYIFQSNLLTYLSSVQVTCFI